jgi:tRNA dimethylallyltransferase
LRNLQALNTVGYKEVFAYLEGTYTREDAIAEIKKNTRNYAKRQMTWYRKKPQVIQLNIEDKDVVAKVISLAAR